MTVLLTDKASEVILDAIEQQGLENGYLAFYVSGGGCSGLQYGLALADGEPDIEDIVVYNNNVKISVDPKSAKYVSGSTIDYVDTSMGGGFKVNNPNETKSCGCGKSFATEEVDTESISSCGSCTKY